jgi:hypothetical protein
LALIHGTQEDINRRTPEVVAMVEANAALQVEEFEPEVPHLTVQKRLDRPGLITGGTASMGNPDDYSLFLDLAD